MNSIKAARVKAKLSRREFCKLFDIPLRTVENWENNVSKPPGYVEKLIIEKLEMLEK